MSAEQSSRRQEQAEKASEQREHNKRELRDIIAKLDRFIDKLWFEDFARLVMTPTALTAEAWDKLISGDRENSARHE